MGLHSAEALAYGTPSGVPLGRRSRILRPVGVNGSAVPYISRWIGVSVTRLCVRVPSKSRELVEGFGAVAGAAAGACEAGPIRDWQLVGPGIRRRAGAPGGGGGGSGLPLRRRPNQPQPHANSFESCAHSFVARSSEGTTEVAGAGRDSIPDRKPTGHRASSPTWRSFRTAVSHQAATNRHLSPGLKEVLDQPGRRHFRRRPRPPIRPDRPFHPG
jgi:hypothetical protein